MIPKALPAPRIVDPNSVPKLRWGVIGPGAIAETFVDATHKYTQQRITAVASRTPGKGDAFARQRGIETVYTDYEHLVGDPNIDVIYVATTHEFHLDHALLAIQAGKHVLVEKPIAITAEQAQRIADAAKAANVLAMEAMWTRYLPHTDVIRQLLADDVFGEITMVTADFGHNATGKRLWNPADGGALLDLGIYPLAWVSMALGTPTSVSATGHLSESGIDEQSIVRLEYASGAQAVVTTSLRSMGTVRASIAGREATLDSHVPFFTPSGFTLRSSVFEPIEHTFTDTSPIQKHEGLSYQATALAKFVGEGLLDSPFRPLKEVVSDIRIIDTARHQIGALLLHER
jgi:predicted dehydrogenase